MILQILLVAIAEVEKKFLYTNGDVGVTIFGMSCCTEMVDTFNVIRDQWKNKTKQNKKHTNSKNESAAC